MSRIMLGSGKFVEPISGFSDHKEKPEEKVLDMIPEDGTEDEKPDPTVKIPPVPEDPDMRPKIIRYAEEYFGRYWIVTLVLLLVILFRKK